MRAIIICAGEATRWGTHLGVPKHFAPVDGEPILVRTVRLLRENGVKDIWIVANDKRYKLRGSTLFVPTLNYKENADADKFLSSRVLWDDAERTVVLYGDVYFTEDAIQQIVNFDKREWKLFCRPGPSRYTGSRWGECFAQSFWPEHQFKHEDELHRIAELYLSGKITRCGGWEHVRAMMNKPDSMIRRPHVIQSKLYYIIDDWTDDFDYPEDYEEFIKRYKRRSHGRVN